MNADHFKSSSLAALEPPSTVRSRALFSVLPQHRTLLSRPQKSALWQLLVYYLSWLSGEPEYRILDTQNLESKFGMDAAGRRTFAGHLQDWFENSAKPFPNGINDNSFASPQTVVAAVHDEMISAFEDKP